MKNFSAQVQEFRKKYDLTQEDLYKLLGCSIDTLQAWEQGVRKPSGAPKKFLSLLMKHPDIIFPLLKEMSEGCLMNIKKPQ